ncbi:MAG: GrpB family protein [Anaerolineaceae bacterium]|nr:GrpB family protein [Anaerolineaceae bacterium]
MRLDFSQVSAERLAELFPILLEEFNPQWTEYYLQEKKFLETIFGKNLIRINHIGSTSVPGLTAKPTVDILLEVSDDIDLQSVTERMKDEGYVVNTPQDDIIMYLKGYTPQGFQGQAVHIHVRHLGDWGELYFRDYLIAHPDIANEYVVLKQKLKGQFTFDRDGYTGAKGQYINKHTEVARREFPNRYTPKACSA